MQIAENFDIETIPIRDINIGKFRIREGLDNDHVLELMSDMKESTQLSPIWVNKNTKTGIFELIDGEHRLYSAKQNGDEMIVARVFHNLSDLELVILSLKSGVLKKQFTQLEEAMQLEKIITLYNVNQKDLAKMLNKTEMWVSRRLSMIINAIGSIKRDVEMGKYSFSHGREIARLPKSKQKQFANLVIKKKMNVAKTKEEVNRILNPSTESIDEFDEEIDNQVEDTNKGTNVIEKNDVSLTTLNENAKSYMSIDEYKQAKKDHYVLEKRSETFYWIRDNLANTTCQIRIVGTGRYYCVTHKNMFCTSITDFVVNLTPEHIGNAEFVEDPIKEKKVIEIEKIEHHIEEEKPDVEEFFDEEEFPISDEEIAEEIRQDLDTQSEDNEDEEDEITEDMVKSAVEKTVTQASNQEEELVPITITLNVTKREYGRLQIYANERNISIEKYIENTLKEII